MPSTSSTHLGQGSLVAAWLGIVRRRWAWGLGVFAVIAGLAALLLFTAHPVYRAQASLRLGEPPPPGGLSPASNLLGVFGLGGDAFANDMELLASRTLAESVVADGSLNVRLLASKDWHRDSIFGHLLATPLTDEATFEVEWSGSEVIVRQTAPSEDRGVVATVSPGESVTFGGVSATFRPWREGMPTRVRIKTLPFSEAVSVERRRIVSERTRREANVVELSYDHTDPDLAETVVQSVVDRFIAFRTQIQGRESGETVDSLRVVANETLDELRKAETALEEFQRTSRLVAPDAQSEAFIERYSDLLSGLGQAQAELSAIDNVLERVATDPDRAQAWTGLVSHPLFLQNETVGLLLAQLTTLEATRNEVASRRTVESREHLVVLEQIEYLVVSLGSVAEAYRTSLVDQIRVAEEMVAVMDAELARMPSLAIELGGRQRDVRVLTEVVVLTEQRLRQEELRQALTFANIQVIDPPKLRFRPIWPRKLLGLAVGFMIAGVFGALALVGSVRIPRSVRSWPHGPFWELPSWRLRTETGAGSCSLRRMPGRSSIKWATMTRERSAWSLHPWTRATTQPTSWRPSLAPQKRTRAEARGAAPDGARRLSRLHHRSRHSPRPPRQWTGTCPWSLCCDADRHGRATWPRPSSW